jgi:hypothetical protein
MLHQLDLCPQGFDCKGICGGDAIVDECGTCGGDGVLDECGVCNGPGAVAECGCEDIPEGNCDCEGNIDEGCGCGEGPVSGCDEACGSNKEFDHCGFCGGGINPSASPEFHSWTYNGLSGEHSPVRLTDLNFEIGDYIQFEGSAPGEFYAGYPCKCPDEMDGDFILVDECGYCGGNNGEMSEIDEDGQPFGFYEGCPDSAQVLCSQYIEEQCTSQNLLMI